MARIVVVGSVGLDTVVSLTSPLRRDAHLDGRPGATRLGGGGANVAVPLAWAGHDVRLVSCVGRDAEGDRILRELEAAGVDTGPVRRVPGPSTRSLVLVDPDGERTVVNLHRAREGAPPRRLRRIAADLVYVRSREGALGELLSEVARRATVVAHVPPCQRGGRPAHVLVASEADLGPQTAATLRALAGRVAGAALRWAVLTRGARGAVALSRDRSVRTGAPPVRVVDATGAGDAFAAGLVHALACGREVPDALPAAVAWGSEAVGCTASALPRDAVRRLLRRA